MRAEALDALATIGGKAGSAPIEAMAGGDGPEADAAAGDRRLDQARPRRGGGARGGDPGEAGRAGPRSRAAPGRVSEPARRRGDAGQGARRAARSRPIRPSSGCGPFTPWAGPTRPWSPCFPARRASPSSSKPLSPSELTALVAEVAAKGDPARGEQVFRRADLNCMSCHSVCKAGGDVGPDLSAVGQISPPDYIINSILNPDQAIKEQYHTLVVLTVEGQVFQGIVTDKDEQRVVLKDATGASRVVPVASIEDQKPGGSLMPKGLANLMTRAEFVDLVRFLSELGKPGPYAIRAVPAIQRWKVLKGVGRGPVERDPDRQRVPGPGPSSRARAVGRGLCQGRRLAAAGRGGREGRRQGRLSAG